MPALHCWFASTSPRLPFAILPRPQPPRENGRLARWLLQLNSGVEASGAGAESEGDARAVDFPSCPRCVAVRVVVSDACKASHIQRSPLSMGGLCELGAVAQWRALVLRKISPSSI